MKVWKGLFYCMWMSDKPLIQVLSCLLLPQEYVLQFGPEVIMLRTVSDLPTPKPCKSGVLEKKLPKAGDFQNVSNTTKKADYFCHGILYPISGPLCTFLLLVWQ